MKFEIQLANKGMKKILTLMSNQIKTMLKQFNIIFTYFLNKMSISNLGKSIGT